mgnify:CR=1 FL=1
MTVTKPSDDHFQLHLVSQHTYERHMIGAVCKVNVCTCTYISPLPAIQVSDVPKSHLPIDPLADVLGCF